jgi:hypothetical protein
MKKEHPHGLPHLSDAKQPDGSVNHDQVLAGSASWAAAIAAGHYSITDVHEYAQDDKTDVLILHRRKN